MSAEELFGKSMGNIAWWQEALRAIVIFVYGLALIRVAGRRLFGKWSALDIIVSIVVGSNLSRALTGSAPLGGTLIATALLIVMHWSLAQLTARSVRFSQISENIEVSDATVAE